jgi:hypothetical protein
VIKDFLPRVQFVPRLLFWQTGLRQTLRREFLSQLKIDWRRRSRNA